MPGIVQWFRFENYEEVDTTIKLLKELNVKNLRTGFSWADWERPKGPDWFDWFIERVDQAGIEIFPTLFYTPAAKACLLPKQTLKDARTSFPPKRPEDYAAFCEEMIARYGNQFGDYLQIWNEPNNDAYWSFTHDIDGGRFAEMAHLAIEAVHRKGKKVVLGGIIPPYKPWLKLMDRYDIILKADAIGIQAFPGTWDKMQWKGWPHAVQEVRDMLAHLAAQTKNIALPEVWITETGFSTVSLEDQGVAMQAVRETLQIDYFESLKTTGANRVFWYCAKDQDLDHPTDNVLNRLRAKTADPRAYYFGIIDRTGRKKPLYNHWKFGEFSKHLRVA